MSDNRVGLMGDNRGFMRRNYVIMEWGFVSEEARL